MANNIDNFDPFTFDDEGMEEEKADKAFGDNSSWVNSGAWGSSLDTTTTTTHKKKQQQQQPTSTTSFDVTTTVDPFFSSADNHHDLFFSSDKDSTGKNDYNLFPSDPMANVSGDDLVVGPSVEQASPTPQATTRPTSRSTTPKSAKGEQIVQIQIHEQFSTLYDDEGSTPETSLQGSIHVTSSDSAPMTTSEPFCLTIQDPERHLDSLTLGQDEHRIQDITSADTEETDRHLRVTMLSPHSSSQQQQETTPDGLTVATYTCSPQLRPIPLLVKSRVQTANDLTRVGLKLRANPSNTHPLLNMVILVAVPPFVQGENVKMSRKGGVWDEMKRCICWNVTETLQPGQVLEIQAQFPSNQPPSTSSSSSLQFPVLVRCDMQTIFSGITTAVTTDGGSADVVHNNDNNNNKSTTSPIKTIVTHSSRILHRKV